MKETIKYMRIQTIIVLIMLALSGISNTSTAGGIVTGKVTLASGDTVSSGMVGLLSQNVLDTAKYTLIDSVAITANGTYSFNSVSAGFYKLLAKPDIKKYPNTVPTYYGNTNFIKLASVVQMKLSGATVTANIVGIVTSTLIGKVVLQNGGGNVSEGYVKLFQHSINIKDGSYKRIKMDSVPLSPQGYFLFNRVIAGYYILFIRPNHKVYPTAIASYYRSDTIGKTSTHHIKKAKIISINNKGDSMNTYIALREIGLANGKGRVKGRLKEGHGFKRAEGDPVPAVDVDMELVPGETIYKGTTDENGNYEMKDVPDGKYEVTVSVPGEEMKSTYYVTVDSTTDASLTFIADSTGIYLEQPSSIEKELSPMYRDGLFSIYPNPSNGTFTIRNYELGIRNYDLKIYNLLGEVVYSQQLNTPYSILHTPLKSGLYFIQLQTDKEIMTKKLGIE